MYYVWRDLYNVSGFKIKKDTFFYISWIERSECRMKKQIHVQSRNKLDFKLDIKIPWKMLFAVLVVLNHTIISFLYILFWTIHLYFCTAFHTTPFMFSPFLCSNPLHTTVHCILQSIPYYSPLHTKIHGMSGSINVFFGGHFLKS